MSQLDEPARQFVSEHPDWQMYGSGVTLRISKRLTRSIRVEDTDEYIVMRPKSHLPGHFSVSYDDGFVCNNLGYYRPDVAFEFAREFARIKIAADSGMSSGRGSTTTAPDNQCQDS